MKIFLFDEYTNGSLRKTCDHFDGEVFELDPKDMMGSKTEAITYFIDQVDVIIVEMTEPTDMTHFLLAQAILANKPTLCLYRKNMPPRRILNYVRSRKTPRPMKTFSYSSSSLDTAVKHFMRAFNPESEAKDDIPSIKYTLRLTPRIDRYLDWISAQQSRTKADVIRSVLAGVSEDDQDYGGGKEST
jgi:hypothetical protein